MQIKDIVAEKDGKLVSVSESDAAREISETLKRDNFGAAVVLDNARKLVGAVSERNIIRALGARGIRVLEVSASEPMSRDPFVRAPTDAVERRRAHDDAAWD